MLTLSAQLLDNFVFPVAHAGQRRMSALAWNDNRFPGSRNQACNTQSRPGPQHGHRRPGFGFPASDFQHIRKGKRRQRKGYCLEVIDNARLQSEGLVQFPSVDDPGTISERATLSFDRTRNSKNRFCIFDLLTMALQKDCSRISESRKTRHVKAFDGAQYAVS